MDTFSVGPETTVRVDSHNEPETNPANRSGRRTFNQTERITARLKDLVRSYPKGLALVKEFLQNADDAGATDLRVIYDRRTHTGSFLNTPGMKVALGPALLFFNDRCFNNTEFDGIQNISQSIRAHDAARTGRFGQGFNTCYSVTDHPSLMTRIYIGDDENGEPEYETVIAWFDPHHWIEFEGEEIIKNAYAWDLWYAQERWHDWVKTFAPAPPHKQWNTKSNSFPGTVFRLPLRSDEDVQKSEIFEETFLDEHFNGILKEVQKVGPALLVFLRSVMSLEIREIDGNGKDSLRYWITTTGNLKEVKEKRKILRDAVHGDPKERLEQWRNSQESLPIVQFDHSFYIYDGGCDLRLEVTSDGNPEEKIIHTFENEFESKKSAFAVLIVHTPNDSKKWIVAGFKDQGEFRTVVIDDPNHELSKELIKDPANQSRSRISELAMSSLGRTFNGTEREETWAVTTGLLRGTNDKLLDAALEVCRHDEKAIPWAGAAVCKNPTPTAQRGGLACFLPLPETNGPVWLHGWFDLHSSRKGITRTKEVGEATKARYDWNLALMKHAVGPAWAMLIEQIREEAEKQTKPYDLWPKSENTPDELDEALLIGFYRAAAERPLIRGRDAKRYRWCGGLHDRDVYSLPYRWHSRLSDPLLAEGWTLVDPMLPTWVQKGFEKISHPLPTVNPDTLRVAFRTDHDIACTLENAPRPALMRRDWISALGEFCAEGDWDRLWRLPFAFLADGLLHTFTQCGTVYWAEEQERILLEPLPHRLLVLDEYQKTLRLSSLTNTVNVHKLDLSKLIDCIKEVLGRPLSNQKWLSSVFNYLAGRPTLEIDLNAERLKELPIIPDQSRQWHQMGLINSTPLIANDSDNNRLLQALTRIDISWLDGHKELIPAITHFATTHEGKFIWLLKPDILIARLTAINSDPEKDKALDNPHVLHPILDFLASKSRFVQGSKHWSTTRQLRILPTLCGGRVSAVTEHIYISSEFQPPEGIGNQYRLLNTGTHENWRNFYETLGVPKLKGNEFIQDIFLPFLTQPIPHEKRIDYLEWLRDNLRRIESDLDHGPCQSLGQKIRLSPILPLKKGSLAAPSRVYHPNSTKELETLLGEDVFHTLDMKLFKHQRDPWLHFFTDLKLPTAPLPDDLLAAIQNQVTDAQKLGRVSATIRDRIKKLVEHLRKNWSMLASEIVGGDKTLSGVLADLAWLPALPKSESAPKYAVVYPTEDRLYKASELIPPGRLAHLIGSKYPILDGPELPWDMSTALKLHTDPTLPEVLEHFAKVRTLGDRNEAVIRLAAIEAYRFIGDHANYNQQILGDLKKEPCVYVPGQWHLPNRCFFNRLPFKTRWAVSLNKADLDLETASSVRKGLENIGVRTDPDHSDWWQMLKELKNDCENPLNPADLNEVRQALRQILDKAPREWLKYRKDLPLPLIDGRLEEAHLTFIPDDPRLERLTPPDLLPLIENNHDAQEIGHIVGAPSLSASLHEMLKEQPVEVDAEDRSIYIEQMQARIKTDEFYECLRRFAYHEARNKKHIDTREAADSEHLTDVRSLRLRAASTITVESFVYWNGKPLTVFEQKKASFFEKEELIVWLSSTGKNRRTGDELIGDELIQVICEITQLTGSLLQLRRVLDCEPKEMIGRLNDNDIAKLPQAEQLIIDDLEPEPVIIQPVSEPIAPPVVPPVRTAPPPAPINPVTEPSIAEQPSTTPDTTPEKLHRADSTPSRPQDDSSTKSSSTDLARSDSTTKEDSSNVPVTIRGRAVTYADYQRPSDYGTHEGSIFDTKAVGDRGEELVKKDEIAKRWNARLMGSNHKGYDLESTFQGETRYIEVKSTQGSWVNYGVPVSYPQYQAAQKYGEAWWLYVVEYLDNAEHPPVIHRIPNPFNRVNEFRFDGGWRIFARENRGNRDCETTNSGSPADCSDPTNTTLTSGGCEVADHCPLQDYHNFIPGAKIHYEPYGVGTIVEVKPVNGSMVLVADFGIRGQIVTPFKPDMIKLIDQEHV